MTTTTILRSDDLTCPSCVAKLEKALTRVPGVTLARVSVDQGRIEVEHDADQADAERLRHEVERLGYGARVTPF